MSHGSKATKGNLPLHRVAKAKASGRGWAAGKGVLIPRAQSTGASRPEFFSIGKRTGIPFEQRCTVEHCAEKRSESFDWCLFHVKAAQRLKVVPPSH